MPDNPVANALLQAVRLPFRLRNRSVAFAPPQKALILQPCCLGQVMLTTPLLAALSEGFPEARFDWAVSDQARMGVNGNHRITRLLSTGPGLLQSEDKRQIAAVAERLKQEGYDTCFVPSQSGWLTTVAWQAGIPQRIGLDVRGHGYAHTLGVTPPAGETRMAAIYLSLAAAAGVDPATVAQAEMEFSPSDSDRAAITRWLVEEVDWLGDVPLVILHPGGEDGIRLPQDESKQWPAQRYARLANHLGRTYGARIILAGSAADRGLAAEVAGMMSFPAANRAGQMSLGEMGALAELASLYAGNDVGPSYVAAAAGCPTLVIYGPTDPAVSAPYMLSSPVRALRKPFTGPFSWDQGVMVEDACAAVDELMRVPA